MTFVRDPSPHQPISRGRLLHCSRRHELALAGLHRPSGRTAPGRDHPINHHVAGPSKPEHRDKAGRPRARHLAPLRRSHAPPAEPTTSTGGPRLTSPFLARSERLASPELFAFFDPAVEIHQSESVLGTQGTFHGYDGLVRAGREVFEVVSEVHYVPKRLVDA